VPRSSNENAVNLLLARAWKEAEDLGHSWVGPDHFLLALLRPADESVAADVLRACGLTHERFAEELARVLDKASLGRAKETEQATPELNPAAYCMRGRAEGMATGLGEEQVGPEHVVLAALWDPYTLTRDVLTNLGVDPENVVSRVASAGIRVPAVPLPKPEQWRWGDEVDVPIAQLCALTAELPGLLPPGTPFAFNHDGKERGWVIAGEDVDLDAYVSFALAAWERGRLPCDCCGFVTLNREEPLNQRRCEVCYWVKDPVQVGDWTYRGGTNGISLVEARENFDEFRACDARFRDRVRAPRPEEFPPWRASAV
jgi:hypothetical protein